MKAISFCLTLLFLSASSALTAQFIPGPQGMSIAAHEPTTNGKAAVAYSPWQDGYAPAPFSRFALGGGISPLGINLQAAINASRHMNIRGVGNIFNYSVNNISTNGLNINGKLNFATGGASIDFYPFANHGFRLSPGALFYNQNNVTANLTVAGGTKFTLNGITYYASSTSPITGNGGLALNSRNPAFSMTTGWGNMVSHRGHWSFPFEIGAAFVGAPSLNLALTGGMACDSNGLNCVNVATDPNVQANLQAQIQKYRNSLNPFQYYPIVSFGTAYSFRIRK